MSKVKNLITNPRIIFLLVILSLAMFYIHPNPYNTGTAIRSIDKGSPAAFAGMESLDTSSNLIQREKIISVDTSPTIKDNPTLSANISSRSSMQASPAGAFMRSNFPKRTNNFFKKKISPEGKLINNVEDYYSATSELTANQNIVIVTTKARYELVVNSKDNETESLSTDNLGINVYNVPKSNLRKGLDLQGGTRVLLKPERKLSREESELIIDVLKKRLNIYGLSDIIVREAKDLSKNQFFLVEIAGANEKEVRELIAKQGKFEAKIANQTVFKGGGDITYVCRSTKCSGIRIRGGGCTHNLSKGGWICGYGFSIYLTPEAAQRQSDVTATLDVIKDNNSRFGYLSEKLELYLDDEFIDDLNIGAGMKGIPVTDISISGIGNGTTRADAISNTLYNMRELQAVMTTGSLPVKLEVAKVDSMSPLMGQQFSKNAFKVGLFAILAVIIIVFMRYRKLTITIPMVLSMLSELVIILGIAAFIKWNLDLAAIAGIIVAIGTGIDDLIVLSDEINDKENENVGWEMKKKNAFFIIIAAFFTTVVAMVPLLFAGAGLLRGFALTTMFGISAGVFIVRPAFAAAVKILLHD